MLPGAWRRLLPAIIGLMLLGSAPGLAQPRKGGVINRGRNGQIKGITVDNLSDYDYRWFHPGLYFGPSVSRFLIEQSDTYIQRQDIAATSTYSPNLSVGGIADVRLGGPESPFILRFAPGVNFLTRAVAFEAKGYAGPADSVQTQEVGSTVIQYPLLLKYQSDRRRNTRVYLIGGLTYVSTATNRRNDPLRNRLRATDNDLLLEYGVGLDLFYPLFKFAPELRFSHGLRNVLVPRNDLLSKSLQSMTTNTVTLYLNIQN